MPWDAPGPQTAGPQTVGPGDGVWQHERVSFFASSETHSAVVLLVGDRAYKFKKPVDLGFLDFTRREARLAACEREVALNRRIAPDVYLGVAEVRGTDGEPCDHLVVMRRMPAERRLSSLVRSGVDVGDDLRDVARQLAALHSAVAPEDEVRAEGSRDAIRRRWADSFDQVRSMRDKALDDRTVDEIESLTDEFLAGRERLFADRMAAGRIVDGHGDLLADDIYCLGDGPRILDCMDFDDRLRWVDGLDDAAFLAMDLEHLGDAATGSRFLNWYAEFAADPAPAPLRQHFIAYRAFVRAKVTSVRHEQGDQSARAEAVRYGELARQHLRSGAVRLVLVGGLPGSGKSTLSGALVDRLGGVLLSTDRVRKELAGLAPESSGAAAYRSGIYADEWTDRTYGELLSRAGQLLARGELVVLDGSWNLARHRELARELARASHSGLVELRCAAAPDVTSERLRQRARAASVSDADEAIAAAMAVRAEPWPEASTMDTGGPVDGSVVRAVRLVRPESS